VGVRLFIAVWPPDEVVESIAGLPRPRPADAGASVRWEPAERWHVTLRFFGRVDEADVGSLAEALLDAPLRPARAVVGPAVEALGRHLLCLPVAGLAELAADVAAATAGVAAPDDDRPFRGHFTLARVRDGRARRLARLLADARVDAAFPVTGVSLLRSDPGPEGPRYEDVAVRPLPVA